MFFFNLSLVEFLGLFAAATGVVTALYLLDRSRRRHTVATLRFWSHSETPSEMQHRRKIQQPWSLLLQLLSLLCLLLALAQLRWGSSLGSGRDHVLILDVSAIMDARTPEGAWMDQARAASQAWLKAVPAGDRVMLVRADALPTAATAFESNHRVVAEGITLSSPGASALNLNAALRFAAQAQRLQGKSAGEIVYAGAGHSAEEDDGFAATLDGLRILPVRGEISNAGLRKVSLRRGADDAWDAYVTVRNDGAKPRTVAAAVLFGKGVVGRRQLTLAPKSEQSFSTTFQTEAAGVVDVLLQVKDDFPGDDSTSLELPPQTRLKVRVYSARPAVLRPVFSSNPRIDAEYLLPAQYRPDTDAAVVVLDRMNAAPPVNAGSIWIDPPAGASPVQIVSSKTNVDVTQWHNENALGAGLRATDVRLARASVFEAKAGDLPVASIPAGPIILARPSLRAVVLGFHPVDSPLRFELVTPLLFANILRWLEPDVFLRHELSASSAGSVSTLLDFDPDRKNLRVAMDGGGAIPYTLDDRTLRFFSGAAGVVRVADGRHEMVYSLTLPDIPQSAWTPPPGARRGVPASLAGGAVARDLWQWLAVLGAAGLLIEWLLYGRARRLFRVAEAAPPKLRKAS